MTGAATLIGTNSTTTSFGNLVHNTATNTMYSTSSGDDSFYSIDRTTGARTLIGALSGPTNPNGLAYNFDNGLTYMVDNNTDTLYTINLTTGAATAIGSTGSGNLLGLAYVNPVPEPTTMTLMGLAGFAAWRRKKRA